MAVHTKSKLTIEAIKVRVILSWRDSISDRHDQECSVRAIPPRLRTIEYSGLPEFGGQIERSYVSDGLHADAVVPPPMTCGHSLQE